MYFRLGRLIPVPFWSMCGSPLLLVSFNLRFLDKPIPPGLFCLKRSCFDKLPDPLALNAEPSSGLGKGEHLSTCHRFDLEVRSDTASVIVIQHVASACAVQEGSLAIFVSAGDGRNASDDDAFIQKRPLNLLGEVVAADAVCLLAHYLALSYTIF